MIGAVGDKSEPGGMCAEHGQSPEMNLGDSRAWNGSPLPPPPLHLQPAGLWVTVT